MSSLKLKWNLLQIYVEVERARLTHILAKMKEDEGSVTEAANIIQELQVETYGSMEKREKVIKTNIISFNIVILFLKLFLKNLFLVSQVELILEQMRLCLAKKDYIRTQIISKKINVKFFEAEDTHDLKLKYYR